VTCRYKLVARGVICFLRLCIPCEYICSIVFENGFGIEKHMPEGWVTDYRNRMSLKPQHIEMNGKKILKRWYKNC
jgi:hypothetical protein